MTVSDAIIAAHEARGEHSDRKAYLAFATA